MKRNLLKRIGAVALAVAVSLTMGTAAFAADTGVITPAEGNTLKITKEILVYNDENITVYGPGVTFNYGIEPATLDEAATVTDTEGKSITVKPGVADGVNLTADSKAEFEKNKPINVTANNPASITDTITATVVLDKFTAAGVYRYKITEQKPSDFVPVGLTRPEGYKDTRFLDVYIANDGDGLKISGYVLFLADDATMNINGRTAASNQITGKTTGFVDNYDKDIDGEAGTEGTGMGDKYYTYNYTINKTIAGSLADKTHAFPFSVATAGAVEGQNFTASTTGTTLGGITGGKAAIGTAVTANLADGNELAIKGLPANTTVEVTETNNAPDAYTVGAVDALGTTEKVLVEDTVVQNGKTAKTAANAVSAYANNMTTKPDASLGTTTFTNTLDEVSPTNVVMRFAPYLFILGAAIVLLVLMRRRKAHNEAE